MASDQPLHTGPAADRFAEVAANYGLDDPEYPLSEYGMDRYTARNLVEFALDAAGVPQRDDNGETLQPWFRCKWLLSACEEAEAT